MRLDMVDAIDSAADKITGTVRVRELWQPPVRELGEVYDSDFVQNR